MTKMLGEKFNSFYRPMIEGKKLLVLGCGDGSNQLQFGNDESLGVDPNHKQIEKAKRFGKRLICDYAENVDLKGEKFDICLLIDVLEHVEKISNVKKIFLKANEGLDVGGLFLLSTTYAYGNNTWTKYDHVRVFTISSIRSWVKLNGFKVDEIYTHWHIPGEFWLMDKFSIGNYRCPIKNDYLLKIISNLNLVKDIKCFATKVKEVTEIEDEGILGGSL